MTTLKLTESQTNTLKLGHDKGTFTAQDLPFRGGSLQKSDRQPAE